MPAPTGVTVSGLRELQTAVAQSERAMQVYARTEFRHVAEPVRREAEGLAVQRIRRMPASHRWSKMRTGITRTLVYVAPRQRGVRSRSNPRSRPKLADLLMDRAMEPALEHHEADITREVDVALDHVIARFNQGGAP